MKKAQILCVGASSMYGVGGSNGGWPDMLKRDLHALMYGKNQLEKFENIEVHNTSVPGAKLEDMFSRMRFEVESRKKLSRKTIVLLHLGANDARAQDTPENYICSDDEYGQKVKNFLLEAQDIADELVCLGMAPMNEEKTMPKISPTTGRKAYFENGRIKKFETILMRACKDLKINCIPIYDDAVESGWVNGQIAVDGVHPNNKGHIWLYEKAKPVVMELLGI